MKRSHNAFSMIELIFVILIMGIIAKFGFEYLFQAYNSFIYSKINNQLESDSEYAVEFITSRLSNRIKDSVITRDINNTAIPISQASGNSYNILEWIGLDYI